MGIAFLYASLAFLMHFLCHLKCRLVVVVGGLVSKCLTLLQPHELQPARLLCPWDSPGKNTGVGCHSLQGNLPTQGSNVGLLINRLPL